MTLLSAWVNPTERNLMETVDVLIPYYNDSGGFEKTLASIKAQTALSQLRLVVVDDGSDAQHAHRMAELLDGSGMPYNLVTNMANRGRPYTRNVLLDHMDGDYVAWLDSGDEWFQGKIERQLYALKSAGVTKDTDNCWATCSYEWREESKLPQQITQNTDGDVSEALLIGKHLRAYLWTILAPTPAMRIVGAFDAAFPRLQDLDFFLRFVSGGGRLIQPEDKTALCAYNKEHFGRNATEIAQSYDSLFAKHDALFQRYSRKLRMKARSLAYKNCARFADANGEVSLSQSLRRKRSILTLRYYLGLS